MLAAEADRLGVAIRRDLPSGVPLIATDDGKLRQIVLNVVSNAIKYTAAGGSVTVRLEVAADAPAVRIVMADTGIGMTADDLAVALTPFGRIQGSADSQRGCTGLGLPLTREFVRLLGGRFSIESAPGDGTTVTVDLPLAPIAA